MRRLQPARLGDGPGRGNAHAPAERHRGLRAGPPGDGKSPQPERVKNVVIRGLTNLTGKSDATMAWRSLVSTQDVVGIKVFSAPGPNSGTGVAVVAAVVEGLLHRYGLPSKQIIVWDRRSRT